MFQKPDLRHTNGCTYSDCVSAQQSAVDRKLNLNLLQSFMVL
jgi:hypothetical protein